MRAVLLSLFVLWCANDGCAAAQEAQFGPDDARGLLISIVVGRESTVLRLVPVNLRDGTHGTPFALRGRGDVRIERAGGSRSVYYAGYYLDPGDYAVLSMNTELSQAGRNARTAFCYARFSAVLSIRAGEVSLWTVVPPALTTWPEYYDLVNNESLRFGYEVFQRSMDASSNVRPAAVHIMPTAFVDFAGETAIDARNCEPRSFEVVHRVEE